MGGTGDSPVGIAQWPVLPKNEFPDTLLAMENGSATVSAAPVGVSPMESHRQIVHALVNCFHTSLMFVGPGKL
jgi:hypothetical protein